MSKAFRKFTRKKADVSSNLYEGVTITDAFNRFIRVKEIEGLAPRTLNDHRTFFRYLTDWLNGDTLMSDLSIDTVRDYIHFMIHEKNLSNSTINIRLRPLKTFLRFCQKEGIIEKPIAEHIKLLKVHDDKLEAFTKKEIQILLKQPDMNSFAGFRDYVMMCVLLETGLHINELLNMKQSHIDFSTFMIDVPASTAKTRKFRQVPITRRIAHLLAELIEEVRDFGTEYIFVSYEGNLLDASSWRQKLKEYEKKAGGLNKRVSPHTFRHTFALLYIMNGGDPFSLQRILGHSTMAMVRRYVQLAPDDIRNQHAKYSPIDSLI